MKYLKITLMALLALVLLLFIGVGLVLHFVNPNDYQGRIAEAVERSIGRKLYFEGNIELSYYPWLGLKVGALRIEDLPKFGSEPFLRLREAGLKLDTWALLRGRVLVDEVLLDGVELKLVSSQTGERNWDFRREPPADRGNLAESPNASGPGNNGPSTNTGAITGTPTGTPIPGGLSAEGAGSRKLDLAVNRVRLSEARVSYDDFKRHSSYVVTLNSALVEDFVLGRDFKISLGGYFTDQSRGLHWAYDLSSRVKDWQGSGPVELNDILLKNIIKLPEFPESGFKADLHAGAISFNRDDGSLAVNALKLNLPGSVLTGQLHGNLADVSSEKPGEAPGGALGESRGLSGDLKLESDPKALLSALGRPWQDNAGESAAGKVMKKLSLDLVFSLRGAILELQKLDGRLDDSHLSGTGQVNLDKGPRIQLTAKLDQLNIDPYLGGLAKAGAASSKAKSAEQKPSVSGDKAGENESGQLSSKGQTGGAAQKPGQGKSAEKPFLESMVLNASLQVGKLTAHQLELQNINAPIQIENGVVLLKPVTFDFYRGKFNGTARINLTGDSRGTLNTSLNQLDVAQLLVALGKNEFLESGVASIKTDLSFNGLAWPEISRSLNGTSSFNFSSGVLNQALVRLIASFTDQVPNLPEIRRIDSLSASFKFNNGVGTNPDLTLRSPSLNGSGTGTVSLPASRMDYRLRVQNIPLIVSGPFSSPSVTVDAAAAVRGVLENPEAIQGVINHPSGVKKGAQEMLKGIFGGGRK